MYLCSSQKSLPLTMIRIMDRLVCSIDRAYVIISNYWNIINSSLCFLSKLEPSNMIITNQRNTYIPRLRTSQKQPNRGKKRSRCKKRERREREEKAALSIPLFSCPSRSRSQFSLRKGSKERAGLFFADQTSESESERRTLKHQTVK